MKSCPQCNRAYTNEAFNYCPVDGAILSTSAQGAASLISTTLSSDKVDEELPISNKYILEDVVLPYFGDSISKATITKWHKGVGEAVKQGEPLYEVSTDKADLEYSSAEVCTLRNFTK